MGSYPDWTVIDHSRIPVGGGGGGGGGHVEFSTAGHSILKQQKLKKRRSADRPVLGTCSGSDTPFPRKTGTTRFSDHPSFLHPPSILPLSPYPRQEAKDVEIEAAMRQVVDALFSVFATLGTVPIIRCSRR